MSSVMNCIEEWHGSGAKMVRHKKEQNIPIDIERYTVRPKKSWIRYMGVYDVSLNNGHIEQRVDTKNKQIRCVLWWKS